MKFKVNVTKFVDELRPVVDVSMKNVNKEHKSAYLVKIEAKQDTIVLTANNGYTYVKNEIGNNNIDKLLYSCLSTGDAVVDATKLISSLESFANNDEVEIISKQLESNNQEDNQSDEMEELSMLDLEIRSTRDSREMQSLPISLISVDDPIDIEKANVQEVSINREIFISGMKKVNFAIGVQEHKPLYLNQLLEVKKEKVKFIAGNGARFAIDEVEGPAIVKSDNDVTVYFPRENILNLLSILKFSSEADIIIRDICSVDNSSAQIQIESGPLSITILSIDINARGRYADINCILNFDHPYRFKSDINDWIKRTKGIRATYSDEIKQSNVIHNAQIDIDASDENNCEFVIKATTNMRAERYIKVTPIQVGENKKLSIRCNSLYLEELIKQNYESGNMLFRFNDESSPIMVEFPDITDGVKDTTEKYCMFFAASSKL